MLWLLPLSKGKASIKKAISSSSSLEEVEATLEYAYTFYNDLNYADTPVMLYIVGSVQTCLKGHREGKAPKH